MIYYTGIGSRETPSNILTKMYEIGVKCATKKFVLRSGAADGADTAFESGASIMNGPIEIYLPWKNFNKDSIDRKDLDISNLCLDNFDPVLVREAKFIAKQFHPKWNVLRYGGELLHTRNVFQVLGKDLKTRSDFLVCWTKDGLPTGGTATAIRIAEYCRIPSFNLFNIMDHEMCLAHIEALS